MTMSRMSSEPEDEPDLDAGWDEVEPRPPVAGTSELAESAAGAASVADEPLDDVDAGWELDDAESSAASAPSGPAAARGPDGRRRRHRNREKKPAQTERTPVAIVKPAPSRLPSLKKVQRALDRKSREKAALARADREQERKRRLELERRAAVEQIVARAAARAQSEVAESKRARPEKAGRPVRPKGGGREQEHRPRAEQARLKPSTLEQRDEKPSSSARSKSEQERKPAATRKAKRERRERRRRARRVRAIWIVGTIALIVGALVVWKMTR
jgi:hypothetical protein